MSSLFHNRFRIVVDRAYDVPVSNGGIHVAIIDSRSTKLFSPHARRRRRHGSRVAAVASGRSPISGGHAHPGRSRRRPRRSRARSAFDQREPARLIAAGHRGGCEEHVRDESLRGAREASRCAHGDDPYRGRVFRNPELAGARGLLGSRREYRDRVSLLPFGPGKDRGARPRSPKDSARARLRDRPRGDGERHRFRDPYRHHLQPKQSDGAASR